MLSVLYLALTLSVIPWAQHSGPSDPSIVVVYGLGILIASFMTSQQGFQLFIQLLMFPLIFLAGVFYPVNEVPVWLEVVSKANPLTYGVDAIRQVFLGSVPGLGVTVLGHTMSLVEEVAVIALLGALLLGGAVLAFNRQE